MSVDKQFTIVKFGGSSVSNYGCINIIKNIIKNLIQNGKYNYIFIFSAIEYATDNLLEIINKNDNKLLIKLILRFYILNDKLGNDISIICDDIDKLEELIKSTSSQIDDIISYGEIITNKIIHEYLNRTLCNMHYIDSRLIIKTDSISQNANVLSITDAYIKHYINTNQHNIYIMPGFISSNMEGMTTTLGRGGGDYTASIMGSALLANKVIIFSNADGIMTSDPRIVKNTKLIKQMTYEHANKISYYGGKILYYKTLIPIVKLNIPIIIRNTFNFDNDGTTINNEKIIYNKEVLCVTHIDKMFIIKTDDDFPSEHIHFVSKLDKYIGIEESIYNKYYKNKYTKNNIITNVSMICAVLTTNKFIDDIVNIINISYKFIEKDNLIIKYIIEREYLLDNLEILQKQLIK